MRAEDQHNIISILCKVMPMRSNKEPRHIQLEALVTKNIPLEQVKIENIYASFTVYH
jgi:hypothetical protein